MKVLFLCNWYPTTEHPHLGLFVKEHARALQKQTNELHVVALLLQKGNHIIQKKTEYFVDENGISTHIITLSSTFKNLLYYSVPIHKWIVNNYVQKLQQKEKSSFDIIHSNVVYPAGIIGNSLSKKLKLPHTITEHWSRLNRMMRIPYYSSLIKNSYIEAATILPVSHFLKDNINSYFDKKLDNKFHVVGNIIDQTIFHNNPEIRSKKKDFIQFIAIASWNKKKQADKLPKLFIKALAEIQKAYKKKIKLIIVGGGNQIDELKELCKNLELNTEFTGFIEKQKIAKKLQESDYFLHASTIETFSIVTAEALCSGTPVVCSNVGALPELVDQNNGILTKNNLDSWVNAIQQAINTEYNHQEISDNICKRFSYEKIGSTMSNVLQDAISRNKK